MPADSSAYLETAVHIHSFKDPTTEHKGYLDSSPEERKIQQLAVSSIDKDTLVKEFTFTIAMRSIQVRVSIWTLSTLLTHCFESFSMHQAKVWSLHALARLLKWLLLLIPACMLQQLDMRVARAPLCACAPGTMNIACIVREGCICWGNACRQ